MELKFFNKLPYPMKNYFNLIYEETIKRTDDEDAAIKAAWNVTKETYSEPQTKKSLNVFPNEYKVSGNYIDVMMGLPTIDKDGEILDFWNNHPIHPIVGDIEHAWLNKIEGNHVPNFEELRDFTPIADRFYNKEDGSLWAKVEIPNHSLTSDFLKRWELGELGVSIEYEYPEFAVEHELHDGRVIKRIKEGKITGFSFTTNPAIEQTRNKNEQ